jgi:hypothetical protein
MFNYSDIIQTIKDDFSEDIKKSELLATLRLKKTENKSERVLSPYNLYVYEKMKSSEIKNIEKPRDRMSKISEMWKEEKNKYVDDKKWYEKVLKKYNTEKEAKKEKKTEKKEVKKEVKKPVKKEVKKSEKKEKKEKKIVE